jgi:hypothetical protein
MRMDMDSLAKSCPCAYPPAIATRLPVHHAQAAQKRRVVRLSSRGEQNKRRYVRTANVAMPTCVESEASGPGGGLFKGSFMSEQALIYQHPCEILLLLGHTPGGIPEKTRQPHSSRTVP